MATPTAPTTKGGGAKEEAIQRRQTLHELARITPTPATRTWQSAAHPLLPQVAVACADKTARIFSLASFRQVETVSGGHKRSVRSVAWKPGSGPRGVKRRVGGKRRARGGSGGRESGGEAPGDDYDEEKTRELVGRGESVLVTGSFDASAGIWRRWERQSGLVGDAGDAGDDEMDFTRRRLGSADDEEEDNSKADGEDGEWQFAVVLDGHDSEIKSVAYSPIAPFLATCSRDKSVWVWEELEDGGEDNFETVAVLQEHEGDVKAIAWHPSEVLLASGSYDDTVRLWREEGEGEDWACAALLEGFGGTVWSVQFEPVENVGVVDRDAKVDDSTEEDRARLVEQRLKAGPRLVAAADDGSIRLYSRVPKDKKPTPTGRGAMPSILRTHSIAEEWVEDGRLPVAHDRAVYAVAWSGVSGRIVSCGGDGRLVVYEEVWASRGTDKGGDGGQDVVMADEGHAVDANGDHLSRPTTTWRIVAEVDDAHDVFEVNHVTWAPRADRDKRDEHEEVIVSTGDGGDVKVWSISESASGGA